VTSLESFLVRLERKGVLRIEVTTAGPTDTIKGRKSRTNLATVPALEDWLGDVLLAEAERLGSIMDILIKKDGGTVPSDFLAVRFKTDAVLYVHSGEEKREVGRLYGIHSRNHPIESPYRLLEDLPFFPSGVCDMKSLRRQYLEFVALRNGLTVEGLLDLVEERVG